MKRLLLPRERDKKKHSQSRTMRVCRIARMARSEMPGWGHILNIQKSGGALNVPSRGGADQVCFLESSLCSNVTNGLK